MIKHVLLRVFSHIAQKMNNVCIFSHNQVTLTAPRVRYGLIPIYDSQ